MGDIRGIFRRSLTNIARLEGGHFTERFSFSQKKSRENQNFKNYLSLRHIFLPNNNCFQLIFCRNIFLLNFNYFQEQYFLSSKFFREKFVNIMTSR